MIKYLLLLIILLMGNAQAEKIETFKNPIFNSPIQLQGKIVKDYLVTPTAIKDPQYNEENEDCEFIAEDEKAIFLHCKYLSSDHYVMMIARYRFHELCIIRECRFGINDKGVIYRKSHGAYSTIHPSCAEEIDRYEYVDETKRYLKMNCLYELQARGWDRYIPAKFDDEAMYQKNSFHY